LSVVHRIVILILIVSAIIFLLNFHIDVVRALVPEGLFILFKLVFRSLNITDILKVDGHIGCVFFFIVFRVILLRHALHLLNGFADRCQRLLTRLINYFGLGLPLVESFLLVIGLIVIFVFIELWLILLITLIFIANFTTFVYV